MKIAVCAINNKGIYVIAESMGCADVFLFFDINTKKIVEEILTNKHKNSANPEIFCAQLLISKGANVVVCSDFEEDAKKLFIEADIKLIENSRQSVKNFLSRFLAGLLRLYEKQVFK